MKFLEKIAIEIAKSPDLSQKIIVLPSKRAGVFLKKAIVDVINKPVISPKIITINEFIEDLSPYNQIDWLPLVFDFYKTYKNVYNDKAQNFDEFIKWAPHILQDFNEIDTYGANAKEVFTYINEVKKIEDWELKPDSPKLITDYLKFYASLYDLYKGLQKRLVENSSAYQGMIYKYVAENIDVLYSQFHDNSLVFIGFNALSKSEEKIIDKLIFEKKANIYWDADKYYLKPEFEAGYFLRKYKKKFEKFNWVFDDFSKSKNIEIIAVSGQTAQAQVVAQIVEEKLNSRSQNENKLISTAVVLNEDNALLPIINSLPNNLQAVNITLGLPIGQLPITQFFEQLLKLHYEFEVFNRYDVETIVGLLHQPYLEQIFNSEEIDNNEIFLQKISGFKTKMLSKKIILDLLSRQHGFVNNLFQNVHSINDIFTTFQYIIDLFSAKNINEIDQLALVHLDKLFAYLKEFIESSDEIKSFRTLQMLFNKLLYKEQLSFEGEPLEGLQIMGILETRLLDFEHVIVTSVNEGVIPKSKNEHSIIPFELKKHFGLLMTKEINSVIAYHFYRLLQRAKKITILYNTDDSGMGLAEQSRFVTQLENELDKNIHTIVKKQLKLNTDLQIFPVEEINKTKKVLQVLKKNAENGFSASALSTYIRNPLVYYKKYILKLKNPDEFTEGIPANTFGTIIHDTLEHLYKPFEGKLLGLHDVDVFLSKVNSLAEKYFVLNAFGKNHSKKVQIEGKNLIAFEIIKKNIKDVINIDKKLLQQNNEIQIIAIEKKFKIPFQYKNEKIFLSGFVDRIDKINQKLRIIDYKTGKLTQSELIIGSRKFSSMDIIFEDKSKAKLFQLLFYALMYYESDTKNTSEFPVELGIISTRSYQLGFIRASVQKENNISIEVLNEFKKLLELLIDDIFNEKIPFIDSQSKY